MTDKDRHKRMQALDKERGISSVRVRVPTHLVALFKKRAERIRDAHYRKIERENAK
jgi:hypothetical protein